MNKNTKGRKRALMVAGAAVVALALPACSEEFASLTGEDCIVLVMGGNKLCGADAKAWCDSTSELREGDPTLGIEPDSESQAVCDGL